MDKKILASKNKVKLEPYKTKILKILKSQLASTFSEIRFSKWEKGMSNHGRRCDGKKLNNCSYDLREREREREMSACSFLMLAL